jgi:hypothetical protein
MDVDVEVPFLNHFLKMKSNHVYVTTLLDKLLEFTEHDMSFCLCRKSERNTNADV